MDVRLKRLYDQIEYEQHHGVYRTCLLYTSNLDAEKMEEVRKYADVDVTQLPLSMVDRSADSSLRWAGAHGMATMTYGSLGAGILSGAIREHKEFDEDDVRGRFYSFFREPEFSKVMELLKSMDKIAEKRGVPV